MAAIDYPAVRSLISMEDVLRWIGFTPTTRRDAQLRGRCPLANCSTRSHRTFSVHLEKGVYHCFTCHAHGNQLDLWAAIHDLPLYHATLDLCRTAHIQVPELTPASVRHPSIIPLNSPNASPRNSTPGPL